MTRRAHRLARALAALALLTGAGAAVAFPAGSTPLLVQPTQELIALGTAHDAYARPTVAGAPIARVPAKRPLTGEQTTLPVLGHKRGADGNEWVHVRLPGRPNGHTGWIRKRSTASSTTRWHLVVQTSLRRLTVYENGRSVRTFRSVVGAPSTPTPHGVFFVEEAIQLRAWDVGGPLSLIHI